MTSEEIRSAVVAALVSVAPEVDASELDDVVELRDQIEIDSMDMLNFVNALYDRFGVSIPESDYSELGSLAHIVQYIAAALAASGS